MAQPLKSLIDKPFTGMSDLTRSVFSDRGAELSTIRRMIFTGNIEGLVESVCILLDQHDPSCVLKPGTKHTRSTAELSLGINQGYIPLDPIYSGLFYFLCQGNHLDIIDIFRILRSRKDWTSSTFREAMEQSEFRQYRLKLYQDYIHIPRSMYYHYLLAKIVELTFNPANGDRLWMWVTPPTDPSTKQVLYEAISCPDQDVYNKMLEELNVRIIEALYYSGNGKALQYYFAPESYNIDPKMVQKDPTEKTYGLNYRPEQSILKLVILRRYFTTYLFVPYYNLKVKEYQDELAASLNDGMSESNNNGASDGGMGDLDQMFSSMVASDPLVKQAKEDHYHKLIASYQWAISEHRAFFKQFVAIFGIDLCYTHDIIAVLAAAQYEHDQDIVQLFQQQFSLDLQSINNYTFNHRERAKHMACPSLLALMMDARKEEPREVVIANILLIFILYNLTGFVTKVLAEPDNASLKLSELSRKRVNLLTLACESPIVTLDTVKFLTQHRCKIYTNSKSSRENNVFLALFMSRYACPQSRMDMANHILDITRRSSDYMPAVTIEEWVTVLRSISHRRLFTLVGYSDILQSVTDLLPRDVVTMVHNNPPVYLREVTSALEFSYFGATLDIFSFPPFFYDIWQHDMLVTMQVLFPPQHAQAFCVALSKNTDLMTFLINTRATDALQYMMTLGYVPTTADMYVLSTSNGYVVDVNDYNLSHLLKRSRYQWWDELMANHSKLSLPDGQKYPNAYYYLPSLKSIEIDRIAFAMDCDYYFSADHEKQAHELYGGSNHGLQQEVILYSQRQYQIRSHFTKPYSIGAAIADSRAPPFMRESAKRHAESKDQNRDVQSVKPLLSADEDDVASEFLMKLFNAFDVDCSQRRQAYKDHQQKLQAKANIFALPGTPTVLSEDDIGVGPLGLGNHYKHGYSTFLTCFNIMRRGYPDFDIAAPIIVPKIALGGGNYVLLYLYSLAYPDMICDETAARAVGKIFVHHCNSGMLYSAQLMVEMLFNHIILHCDSSPETTQLIEQRRYDEITITPGMAEHLVNFILINFNHFIAEAIRSKDFGFSCYSFFQLFFERLQWVPHIFLKRVLSPDTAMLTQDGGIFINILDQFVAYHGSATLFVDDYRHCSQPLRWLAMVLLNSPAFTPYERQILSDVIGFPLEISNLAYYLGLPTLTGTIFRGGAILAAIGAVGATAWYVYSHVAQSSLPSVSLSTVTSFINAIFGSSSESSSNREDIESPSLLQSSSPTSLSSTLPLSSSSSSSSTSSSSKDEDLVAQQREYQAEQQSYKARRY